jgi:acyl carrier protein
MIYAIFTKCLQSQTRTARLVAGSHSRIRNFSTSVVDRKIREAVDEYVKLRKSEAKEYNPSVPSDKVKMGAIDTSSTETSSELPSSFASMGLDGLDEVELVLTIESKFGITLSDEDFHAIHSVSDAIRIIDKITNNDAR